MMLFMSRVAHVVNTMQAVLSIIHQVRGQLSKLERKTIGALIVIDVHARDVCKILAESNVTDEQDFDWISQLRSFILILHSTLLNYIP